jgi:LDH2 family malate/lactate/ureidoglycolate dehydrogenase
MPAPPPVPPEKLAAFATAVFVRLGISEADARVTSDALVQARSLRDTNRTG